MATEADTPQPVPLMETVHLTAGEFNQPPERTDYLLKHAHESSNLQNVAAHFDTTDDLGVSKDESFLKSSLEPKVAGEEDTCRKQEPFQAVKMPHEAEKRLEENEKQIHIDENFDSAETVSKETDASVKITDREQNVGENSEFVDSTEIMKIQEPELQVQETISSEEKIKQVAEIVNVDVEIGENTNDCKNTEETTKTDGYAEAEISKEVDKPEGILDQDTEVSARTPNLTLNSKDGGVQTIKDAYLKDETENCTAGTDASHIEGSVTEPSAEGAEEKQRESCSSLLNEQSSQTIKLSEKESSNDSVVAESLCTQNDQIGISESKEVTEDEPDVSSASPATNSSPVEETDLIVHETEKTTAVACTAESQEPIKLSENVKDASQIVDEMQEEKVEGLPVAEMDIYVQKEDNSVSADTLKEIPEEIGASEVVEGKGKIDRREADKVEDEINPEQGVSEVFMKHERNIEVEVSAKEISGEEKNGGEDAAKESEIDLSDATSPAAAEENKVEIQKDHEIDLHGKLANIQDVDDDHKDSNSNAEETVEKKEDSCDIQMPKLETSEEPDENQKYNSGEVTSDEVINTAFVEQNTEHSSQPGDRQEAEPINEDTVNICQDTVEVEEVSGKEDDGKQITEESLKGLSQESVEGCLDENFQNQHKSIDISSGEVDMNLVHEEAETGKPVDISSDTMQNDETSASTLQTYQEKEEESLQTEEVTASGPSASEAKGKDMDLMIKDRESENNEVLEEVKENKETEASICRLKRTEKNEEDLQNNESVENLQEITGVVTDETEKDDSSKTVRTGGDETVESPQDNVIEEETQNDEKNSENSNIESLETSENVENSNSTVEACLTKEQEILKDENSVLQEASATEELHGNDSSNIKDEQLENNALHTEVKEKIEESTEHQENLERTQKNTPVENQEEPNIIESSETTNHVSDEIIKDLEVETVGKDGSDINEDNAVFEAVDEDIPDTKTDTAEGEVANIDENDSRSDKVESETFEKDNLNQADNAEVETFEEDTVDKKEDIGTDETVEENNLQKVVDDAEVEKIEKDASEVEIVEENGLDKNAENAEVEKDYLDKKDDESKGEVKEGVANALDETIKEEDVAKIEKAGSTCKEDRGEHEDLKEQLINDSAILECAEPSPLEHSQTDAKNTEDSNDKHIELSKSAEKDENIADDANQKDEILSTCISTSLVQEAEKSHEECETVPPSQSSLGKKEEADVSQIEMGEYNENTALAETNATVDEEPSKEVDNSNEKSQNEESTNTALQTSRVEEQELQESDNQAEAEASPTELKDEDQSHIKTDQNNDNDDVVLEVEEEKQDENLKDEESISMISEETMVDASSKTTGEVENAKTPDNLGKDSEVGEEENTIPEASDHQDPVESQNEEYNENSSGEILGEFETVRSGENIVQEKDQKDESPCTIPPGSAEVSIDEHTDKDDTPENSGENNDCNAYKREVNEETSKSEEIVEQSTGVEETSKKDEKLEEEPPKNQPEELLEQSSNSVVLETDAVTLSERAIDTSLGEVGTLQNDEEKIEEGREEKEETGKINADQEETTATEEVSTETNISVTSENTGKLDVRKEETETDILSEPAEIETSLTEAQVEEKVNAQDASDTVEQAPEEENIVKDRPDEIADEKMNEDEMIISESKQEVNEIIQTAEKQMIEEGNAVEDKAKEHKTETDQENSEEKEIEKECNEAELKKEVEAPKSENKNESNEAELKEEVEEPKSDVKEIIEASGSEEAKGSKTTETKEGSEPLPAACTDSLPEISSSKSEDKDEIIEKEEPNPNDISSLSVTEEAKEISLSEPETDVKVQAESSIPTSEESGLKLNSEETTPNDVNADVSEEQMNEGENKDQETLEAVDQVKEDTDKLEKQSNSEGGVTIKSEASSKEAVETEKSEIEQNEGDTSTKCEVDISNETVKMEERAIAFEEAIYKEENSTTKAEVSSKEDAAMNNEMIEPEVPISAEENSVKEVEEVSPKEAIEPETAITQGALTTKPVASLEEAIEGDNKEIKQEEVTSKGEYSANESLKEVEAEKVTVEPEIATSEAENPIATVEISSETAIEVEKAETELEAAAFKERDLATKAEVALNEDFEAEKEATQPEVEAAKEATQPEAVTSEDVDPATEVEEISDATISKEEDSVINAELSSKEVEAEKLAVEPEIAASEAENPVATDEASSETAAKVERVESEPEAASTFKEGDSAAKAPEVDRAESEPEAAVVCKEWDSATKAEADTSEDVEAAKEAAQPEVVTSQDVDLVTEVEESSDATTSKQEDSAKNAELPLKEIEAERLAVEPEIAASAAENPVAMDEVSSETAAAVERAETEPEAVAVCKEGDSATKAEADSSKDVEAAKEATEPEIEESSDATISIQEDSAKDAELSLKEVEAEKLAVEPEIATSEAENPTAVDEVSSETAAEVERAESEPEAASAIKEGDSATKAEAASNEAVEAAKEAILPELVVSQEVNSVTQVEEICEVAISEGEDLALQVKASLETNTIQPEEVVSQEVDSMTKIEASSDADTSAGENSAREVEASSKAVIKEEKLETRVSEEEDLATKVELEEAIPTENDSAMEFEEASEEDTAAKKSTTQPEMETLEEVDSVTKLEIEPEGAITEERDSATEMKAVSEDDVMEEKSTTEPELTNSEEADYSVTKVGGSTKEAELEKVDIEAEGASFEERDSFAEVKVAEYVETEKSTTEPEVAIYEEVDSTTTVGQSTQEADEVEKQDTDPEADISIEKDSATAFEAGSEDSEAQKSTTKAEVAISEEVDPAIVVGGSSKEAYEEEKQDTEPEADILKEEDSAAEFEAASEVVEGHKSTTEPEPAISEEVNSVAKFGGSTKEAGEAEKQDTEPEEAISKEEGSAKEFEAASEGDNEVQKSTTKSEVAFSEVDAVTAVEGCKKKADGVEKQEIEPEAATSKENNSASEFVSASEEGVKAERSTSEAVISEEAVISKEKDSTVELEAAKEEGAEVQKLTSEPEVTLSEEEKQDIKPEAAMTIEKDSVTECDAASEDAEGQKLTIITEVTIPEEVDSDTKVERSINEVEKSDNCGEKDSEAEASLTKVAEVAKADICEDTKVEASLIEADEVKKAAAEPEASVHKAEDSEAKVEMTNDNADKEKEAAEGEASIRGAEDSDAKIEMTDDNADEEKEAAEPAAAIQSDLVTEAELSKVAVEVEKEAAKAEDATSEAVVSDRNLEDRSVEADEDEKTQMELDRSVPEIESKANKIHEIPMDSNAKSSESGKRVDCSSEIGTSGQGDEIVSETTKSETENRNDSQGHSSESTEKESFHETQVIQLDTQEKVKATVEEEAPKTDDTIKVATSSTEVYGDAEKNDAKELHTVSVQEERINDVTVSCSESIESLNATKSDSDEVQKIAEISLEEAQVNEIEGSERNIAVETIESQVLSLDLASKAFKVAADGNVVEVKPQDDADIVEESRKESETVADSKHEELYTAESEAEVEATVEETTEKEHGTEDETKESKQDFGEIGEKTKEVSQETLVSQPECTVMENDIPIVKTIPEELKEEKCEAQETTEVAEKETPENVKVAESKTDSDIVEESQKQELFSAETGEANDVIKSIFKNQIEEAVIEKEVIVLPENSEEETKEQQETAIPVLPTEEETCETEASEQIEQNKREILSKADETPESSSEQKTTGEVNLQQEEHKVIEVSKLEPEIKTGDVYTKYEECEKKEQIVGEMKDEIKQSFVGVEPATEVVAASEKILAEQASEAQNKTSSKELVLEEQEHGTWTLIEKKEQRSDETEVLKRIAKETEESCFDKEESKKPEVSTNEATETQVGAVQIVNEGSKSTYYDSRETGEIKDSMLSSVPSEERKGQDEMAVISKEIQMESPNVNAEEKIKEVRLANDENLPEKTAVSDKIVDCGTETNEVTFGSESRSHEGVVESEAETDAKVPEAALTQSITEENLSKETESIPNEVKKEQIELEKQGAKDCPSISHGEEITKDEHVEFKLTAEDSNVNEKEKNIEEVHVEEETDARKTTVDQIINEKRTVEQPRQAVAEDIMEKIIEKETREVTPPFEEVKSGELSKEVPTGITSVTNQEEYFNATPENQITREAEPKVTTEVTTTDRSVETTEKIEAIAESTELAKISLFDMMQRSTREKQATTQECESKDEVKAETEERPKSDEEKDDEEDDEEHKKNDSGSDAPVMVEASKDLDVKVPHKKSHNILSGVGSKVKHSISKVKKAITGKSSHSKQNSPKSGTKEPVNPGY